MSFEANQDFRCTVIHGNVTYLGGDGAFHSQRENLTHVTYLGGDGT